MRCIAPPTAAGLRAALALGALALAFGHPAVAQPGGRLVQCRVESAGRIAVSGPCRFMPDDGGSFALENADRGKPLFDEILTLSVSIVAPGVAEVRGLTHAGINSRWGEARRSKRDGACWEGTDFRVCAY